MDMRLPPWPQRQSTPPDKFRSAVRTLSATAAPPTVQAALLTRPAHVRAAKASCGVVSTPVAPILPGTLPPQASQAMSPAKQRMPRNPSAAGEPSSHRSPLP